jgi:hypothetical protein
LDFLIAFSAVFLKEELKNKQKIVLKTSKNLKRRQVQVRHFFFLQRPLVFCFDIYDYKYFLFGLITAEENAIKTFEKNDIGLFYKSFILLNCFVESFRYEI